MKLLFKLLRKIISLVLIISAFVITYICFDGYSLYIKKTENMPIETKVENIKLDENFLEFNEIPSDFCNAIIAIEDHNFYKHNGFDLVGIARSFVLNITSKDIKAGGSTITQQLAKNMYFSFEKKLSRKVAEAIVAYKLEKDYSKEDILAMYVSVIYYGDGYYGLKEASSGYFDKDVNKLNFDEITLLAGLPNAPSVYQLSNQNGLAEKRQEYVIDAMKKYGLVNE